LRYLRATQNTAVQDWGKQRTN